MSGELLKNLGAVQRRRSSSTPARKSIVILFSDDSTLIFARRMRDLLWSANPSCQIEMVLFANENALSYRQLRRHLPGGADRIVNATELTTLTRDPTIAAIITSRVFKPLSVQVKKSAYRWSGNRPCIISFLGGLDFFPDNGFLRRSHCDGVFLFPESAIDDYRALVGPDDAGWQHVDFGHPSVTAPQTLPPNDLAKRSDIYFFTQAISPLTRRSREHVLRLVIALARANPDRNVFLKLRHLPSENKGHLHKEQFDYPALLDALGNTPNNLHLTDDDMETALGTAAIGITCTSTAALDVVRAGVPCMIYLDYVDHYRDRLVEPMRTLFKDSNLIMSLDDILNLRTNTPNPAWAKNMFCPDDLATRVFDTIDAFNQRPVQIAK